MKQHISICTPIPKAPEPSPANWLLECQQEIEPSHSGELACQGKDKTMCSGRTEASQQICVIPILFPASQSYV